MGADNDYRPRKFMTFKIYNRDRDMLQNLARVRKDTPDRHAALIKLAEVVPDLDLEDIRDQERRALRLGLPPELEKALQEKQESTGQPIVTILTEGVHEYWRRYSIDDTQS